VTHDIGGVRCELGIERHLDLCRDRVKEMCLGVVFEIHDFYPEIPGDVVEQCWCLYCCSTSVAIKD